MSEVRKASQFCAHLSASFTIPATNSLFLFSYLHFPFELTASFPVAVLRNWLLLFIFMLGFLIDKKGIFLSLNDWNFAKKSRYVCVLFDVFPVDFDWFLNFDIAWFLVDVTWLLYANLREFQLTLLSKLS